MADKKQNDNKNEKKRKESILDLSKYLEKQIRVKFAGKIFILNFVLVKNCKLSFLRRKRVLRNLERFRSAAQLGARQHHRVFERSG
jgi:ribosomal protein S25